MCVAIVGDDGRTMTTGRWQWVRDRLAAVPTWRLWWALVMPIGFGAFWLVGFIRTGQVAWAAFFGILLAISIATVLSAVGIRASRHRNQAPRS